MTSPKQQRLSATRKARVRTARIAYHMSRYVDPQAGSIMPGQQSWYVSVSHQHDETRFARIVVHRVPLHNGHDLALETDSGDYVPGSPVMAVVNWDALKPLVQARMPDPSAADDLDATFLVVEPVELEPEWHGMGVAELLLAVVLVELQTSQDAIAVGYPVPWPLNGRARRSAAALQKPIFGNLGFKAFKDDAWLLTEWHKLHKAHESYKRRFSFELPFLE